MHTNGQGILCCSRYVPIDVVKWMTRTGQKDVLVLSRCKNFGDGMGGSGEEGMGLGFGLWANFVWVCRRAGWLLAACCGGGVGDWSLNAPGAPVGMCVWEAWAAFSGARR